MERIISDMENRKAIRISFSILAPILLIVYWRPIIEIGIVGGTAFGLIFMMVKHHKKLFRQAQNVQKWILSRMNRDIHEEKTN